MSGASDAGRHGQYDTAPPARPRTHRTVCALLILCFTYTTEYFVIPLL